MQESPSEGLSQIWTDSSMYRMTPVPPPPASAASIQAGSRNLTCSNPMTPLTTYMLPSAMNRMPGIYLSGLELQSGHMGHMPLSAMLQQQQQGSHPEHHLLGVQAGEGQIGIIASSSAYNNSVRSITEDYLHHHHHLHYPHAASGQDNSYDQNQ